MHPYDRPADYLADPTRFEEGREPTHATATIPYPSVDAARAADEPFTPLESRFAESPFFQLLDGDWDFQFYERPAEIPSDPDENAWDTIEVPRNWQTEGYDQTFYVNRDLTWNHYDPPLSGTVDPREDIEIPETNPTGVYRRTVSVPTDWDGREVFLHFEGVKQAFFVWVDGEYVGYQQGSMTPGEFDVTDHVGAGGDHEVTVQVHRFADSEALETIDMFRYAGIFRSVYLFSTPQVHVRDFFARTGLDDDYEDGYVRVEADVTNYAGDDAGDHELRATLFDPDGEQVATRAAAADVGADGAVLDLDFELDAPRTWSAETPDLYELGLELVGPDGAVREALFDKVGVVEYETTRGQRGSQVLVNGEPTNVRGTNRHEADPDRARAIPVERQHEDIEVLKRHNFNAVRTSHYPNDPSFYRLADEYGLYVQDEVGVETHWWEGLAQSTTAFHDQYVAYFRRMVLRDRNHASVFSWSTGNEAGTGAEHLEMASLVMNDEEHMQREVNGERYDGPIEGLDATRILYHQPNGNGWVVDYNDMLGPRYPSVDTLLRTGDGRGAGDGKRPVVMGEYNHAMGNSLGLVEEMWGKHIQPPVRRARDRSDTGADGVLVGNPAVEPGHPEPTGAVALGPDDRIEVRDADALAGDGALTVAASVRDLTRDGETGLVSAGPVDLRASGGDLRFRDGEDAVSAPLPAVEGPLAVAGVRAGDELRLVANGDVLASAARSVDSAAADAPAVVGGEGAVTVEAVGVFGAALDAGEVGEALRGEADEIARAPRPADDARLFYDFAALLRDQSLMGGFLWDWVNQDLNATIDVDGEAIDYQFYDDDPFCLNGLVWSDRTPTPGMAVVSHCHQPVGVADADLAAGEVYVTNHHAATDLSAYDVTWSLAVDDETVASGDLDASVPPGETRRVTVPFEIPEDLPPGAECWLAVSVRLAEDAPWADAGFEVAAEQLSVPVEAPDPDPAALADVPPVSVADDGESVVVTGDGFEYAFDRDAGTLGSLAVDGTELLERGPLLNAWRTPIMNEAQAWDGEQASAWYEAGLDDLTQEVESVTVDADEAVATVEVSGFLAGADLGTLQRTPNAVGGHATVQGDPGTVSGASGAAAVFDGDAFLTVERDDAGALDDGLTLECWVRPGEGDAGPEPYVTAGGQYLLKRRGSDRGGDLELSVYSDGWHVVHAPVPDDWADGWHHLAGVWDPVAGDLALYVDGEAAAVDDFGGQSGDFNGRVRVGRNRDRFVSDGTAVDEVRVYRRGLDAAEVGRLDDAPAGAFAHLPLDDFEAVEQAVPGFDVRYRYRVFGTGDVALRVEADPNEQLSAVVEDYLPKLGVRTELREAFDAFEWYGRGPTETYPDRKAGVPVGRYAGAVADQHVPYIPPTDSGNKTDTRWAALTDGDVGLLGRRIEGTIDVNLAQWANLGEADHEHELEPRGSVGFDLDHEVSGLGGTPRKPSERFYTKPEETAFEVLLRPFAAAEDAMAVARRPLPK